MARDVDHVDRLIIAQLVKDSRLSIRQLAERVHISRSAAHSRLNALISAGVVRRFTVNVDKSALGMNVSAIVVIKVGDRPWPAVRDDLAGLPCVEKVQAVSGDIDALLTVNAASNQELSEVILRQIHEVPGVVSTRSLLVLDEVDGQRPGG